MCVVLFWVLVYLFPVKELVRKPEVEYYTDLELKVFFFFFFFFFLSLYFGAILEAFGSSQARG